MRYAIFTLVLLIAAQSAFAQSYGGDGYYGQKTQTPQRLHSIDGEDVPGTNPASDRPAQQRRIYSPYATSSSQTNSENSSNYPAGQGSATGLTSQQQGAVQQGGTAKQSDSSGQSQTAHMQDNDNVDQNEANFVSASSNRNLSSRDKDCGIWICLPGGFPSSCEDYYDRFKWRIRHGKQPLIDYSKCKGDGNGTFQKGREYFYACKEGYKLVGGGTNGDDNGNSFFGGGGRRAYCINTDKSCISNTYFGSSDDQDNGTTYGSPRRRNCDDYRASRRQKTRYIEVQVDNMTYPRFYY